MAFKIIGDSCCDFTKLDYRKGNVASVPMSILIGGVEYRDDGSRTQEEWIRLIKEDPGYPQSACPSPDAFMAEFEEDKDNYVIALSSKLSGVYNSAMLAKQIYEEDHEDARIHVFDTRSAAAGEHLMYELVAERAAAGMPFEQVVEEVEELRDRMQTIFVLDDLETFRKNGRLKGIKALVATTMNIKPVLVSKEGEVDQIDQAIGMQRAVNRMLWHIEKMKIDPEGKKVRISHCDSKELCTKVALVMRERFGFQDIKIISGNGLTTTYENPGGIVMAIEV